VVCERLFTLYRQQCEKDKRHVDLAPLEKFLRTPMVAFPIVFKV